MKGPFFYILIIVTIFIGDMVLGQQKGISKLDISIIGGLSLPIGSYGENDPSKSAIYANASQVKGFAKEMCGFAKTGYNYNLEIGYKVFPHFKILLITGSYLNPVETKNMSDFMTVIFHGEIRVEEESYKYFYFNPGIGYYQSLNRFEFGLNLFMGYSLTSFPYYKFVFASSTTNPPDMFAHDGPRPNLNALSIGTSISATYSLSNRFKIGIDANYQRADFKYTMSPRLIPGGGGADLTFSDILKCRVINLGLKFGYVF